MLERFSGKNFPTLPILSLKHLTVESEWKVFRTRGTLTSNAINQQYTQVGSTKESGGGAVDCPPQESEPGERLGSLTKRLVWSPRMSAADEPDADAVSTPCTVAPSCPNGNFTADKADVALGEPTSGLDKEAMPSAPEQDREDSYGVSCVCPFCVRQPKRTTHRQ